MFQCTDFPGFLICHFRLYLEFKNEESLLLQFVSGIYQIDCTINIEALLCLFDLDPVDQGQICLCQTILCMRFPISTLYILSDPYFKSYTLFFEIMKLNFEMAAILNFEIFSAVSIKNMNPCVLNDICAKVQKVIQKCTFTVLSCITGPHYKLR